MSAAPHKSTSTRPWAVHRDTPTKRSLYGILPRFVKVIACTDDGLATLATCHAKDCTPLPRITDNANDPDAE